MRQERVEIQTLTGGTHRGRVHISRDNKYTLPPSYPSHPQLPLLPHAAPPQLTTPTPATPPCESLNMAESKERGYGRSPAH
ncbi:hypothetical protein FKM82_021218 [Ascaphus truei]